MAELLVYLVLREDFTSIGKLRNSPGGLSRAEYSLFFAFTFSLLTTGIRTIYSPPPPPLVMAQAVPYHIPNSVLLGDDVHFWEIAIPIAACGNHLNIRNKRLCSFSIWFHVLVP